MSHEEAPTRQERADEGLEDIRRIFGLSTTDLATLFGVSRPTAANWLARGAPVSRRGDVRSVLDLAHFYARKFELKRVPRIVRTPADGLSGRTVLQVIASGEPQKVRDHLKVLFAYLPT
jgi:hypothetical protein